MTIVRAPREDRFTILNRSIISDDRLSFRALGLLTFILDKPDDWRIDSTALARGEGREGRDAVRTALTELESAGYLRRRRIRRDDGTFDMESTVYDMPVEQGEPGAGEPGPGIPAPVDQAISTSTETDDCEQERPTVAAERRSEAGPPVAAEQEIIAQSLCDEMANAVGDFTGKRPRPSKTWCQDMERMVRIDGRDPDEIRRVIRWLYSSADDVAVFWAPNVLCPGKLRTKWATIAGQAGRKRAKPESVIDRAMARLAAEDATPRLRAVGE